MATVPDETALRVAAEADPRAVLSFAVAHGLEMVDLRFTDVPGTLQHFTVPIAELCEEAFTAGLGFDGSSIRGFQEIQECDMLLIPDPATALVDPFYEIPTLA